MSGVSVVPFPRLALFDLDNTLLRGDSEYEWMRFLAERGLLAGASPQARNEKFFADYAAGNLDVDAFMAFQLEPLARHPRALLEDLRDEFIRTCVLKMIAPGSARLLLKHADDLRVIVTATNSFVSGPIARQLGIENLVATEPEQIDGVFTGCVLGTPNFREGKVARMRDWLSQLGRSWDDYSETWFYSDSCNDLPLLSAVDHPVAVDPDSILSRHAADAGWPVISLCA